MARASKRVALINSLLGEREAAIQAFQRAIDSFFSLHSQQRLEREDLQDLALCHRHLGALFHQSGNLVDALESCGPAYPRCR